MPTHVIGNWFPLYITVQAEKTHSANIVSYMYSKPMNRPKPKRFPKFQFVRFHVSMTCCLAVTCMIFESHQWRNVEKTGKKRKGKDSRNSDTHGVWAQDTRFLCCFHRNDHGVHVRLTVNNLSEYLRDRYGFSHWNCCRSTRKQLFRMELVMFLIFSGRYSFLK